MTNEKKECIICGKMVVLRRGTHVSCSCGATYYLPTQKEEIEAEKRREDKYMGL